MLSNTETPITTNTNTETSNTTTSPTDINLKIKYISNIQMSVDPNIPMINFIQTLIAQLQLNKNIKLYYGDFDTIEIIHQYQTKTLKDIIDLDPKLLRLDVVSNQSKYYFIFIYYNILYIDTFYMIENYQSEVITLDHYIDENKQNIENQKKLIDEFNSLLK